MHFEFDNNIPIYIQLVEQIKIQIISGELSPGERLPSVRELALITKVNPNTMQKALLELEETGLIFTERTNGKFVTNDSLLIETYKKQFASELTQKYINSMKKLGLSPNEAAKFIKEFGGNN